MATFTSSPRAPFRAQRGFALLITITLLAFLVILLVGLATYTRVETAVAGNTQRQAQARQNALLAVNVAVSQLQKYAGPDASVTATADAMTGVDPQKRRYTGVWTTTVAGSAPVWLASGLESGTSPDVTQALPAASRVSLVGPATDGTPFVPAIGNSGPDNVAAELQTISSAGVPGQSGSVSIGKYAWWVGDNGVKADVGRPDITSRVDYAPFDSAVAGAEMRTRLLQQTSLGAGAFATATSTAPFDSRDPLNTTLAANAGTVQQMPFFLTRNAAGDTLPLGFAQLKTHYHDWTVGNYAVLARTNTPAGQSALRNDLSLNSSALGTAFSAWSNYPSYMEEPRTSLRRRYKMTPAVTDATNGSQFGVAPVLAYMALAFSIRNDDPSSPTALECSMRSVVGLWNPHTGALVPEDLEIWVTGLPVVDVRDSKLIRRRVDLQDSLGDTSLPNSPVRFTLPWVVSTTDDQHFSWLPGRVHNWSALSNTTAPTTGGNLMDFDVRDLTPGSGTGIVRPVGPPLTVNSGNFGSPNFVARQCFVNTPVVLQIELRRASDGATLAKFQSPSFDPFPNGSHALAVDRRSLDFAFVFRQSDPVADGAAWLQTDGLDPRLDVPPATVFTLPANAVNPELYVLDTAGDNKATFAVGNPSVLLDRYFSSGNSSPIGVSFNEDVSLFELPRSPLLSLGQLQHLTLVAQRPFWIGNSAAAAGPVEWNNALFDQHFFSGLGSGTAWDPTKPLPNTLARVLRHKPDGTAVVANDFAANGFVLVPAVPATDTEPEIPAVLASGISAKYLLQGGAFNLNSTEPDAWAAVLRSVRFSAAPAGREFQYLDASDATGTNADSVTATLTAEAVFPRFSHSAQETYKFTANYPQSEPGTSTNTVLHTEYYRQGFRTLDAATVTALAQAIATAVKTKIAATGPFLSLEEFLNPAGGLAGTPSLLEQAIIDLKLNVDPNDPGGGNYPFSSSYLTQADIMTVLAPVLFVRSDTFTVRAYGEATNPATGATEGKAWCEAIVQRFPEPHAPATAGQPTDAEYQNPPGDFGRRFKIISLRWLTKSDI